MKSLVSSYRQRRTEKYTRISFLGFMYQPKKKCVHYGPTLTKDSYFIGIC